MMTEENTTFWEIYLRQMYISCREEYQLVCEAEPTYDEYVSRNLEFLKEDFKGKTNDK